MQNSSGEGIPAAPEPAGHAREGALPQTRLVPLCPPNLPALHSPLLSPSFNPSPASEHFVTVSPKQSLHGFATEQITLQMPTLTDAQKLDSLAKTTEGEKKNLIKPDNVEKNEIKIPSFIQSAAQAAHGIAWEEQSCSSGAPAGGTGAGSLQGKGARSPCSGTQTDTQTDGLG